MVYFIKIPQNTIMGLSIFKFFSLLLVSLGFSAFAAEGCGYKGFRIDANDVNHQGWVHFEVDGCKFDFESGLWVRTAKCATKVILSNNVMKNIFSKCAQYITNRMSHLLDSNRSPGGFFARHAERLGYKAIATLARTVPKGAPAVVSAGIKIILSDKKVKSVARMFGYGLVVTIFCIGNDVRAEGPVMGVAKNVPGLDVVIEGNRTIDEVFQEINSWSEDSVNNQVKISHMITGGLLEIIQGKMDTTKDPEAVMNCITDLYGGLQSSIYRRIANQPSTNIDWAFLKQNQPYRKIYIQPKITAYYKCVESVRSVPVADLPRHSQVGEDSNETHR